MATRSRMTATAPRLLALLAGLAACSNDVQMPSNYHDGLLAAPDRVEATVAAGAVTVTWQMADRDEVVGFVVSFADTTGAEVTHLLVDPAASAYTDADLHPATGDVWIVRLWAVAAGGFYGPRSAPDTLRVP